MELREFATEVVRKLAQHGHVAYFAGGCVRDMLLGCKPKDYDVATSAKPNQVIDLFPRNVPVGVSFGVVRVLDDGDPPLQVEVATFRGESDYADGRHPGKVEFVDAALDVNRRDFTINGMLFDPLTDKVVDLVTGQEDLKRRVIRAIGAPQDRFREDRLRMLRCVRFATRLGFDIDEATFVAVKAEASSITDISSERIRDELTSMLTGPDPKKALELLKETGLLKAVLSEVDALAGVEQPPEFHPEGDVWVHTLALMSQLRNPTPTLAWGTLLHDIGKPPTFMVTDRIRFNGHDRVGAIMAKDIMERLMFSSEETECVFSMVAQHMVFAAVKDMRKSTLKRFLRQPNFDELLELHRVDCIASHGQLDAHDFCRSELASIPPEELRPQPLLTGHDLISMGLKPGPTFKIILKEVEDKQLDGSISTKDQAIDLAREWRDNFLNPDRPFQKN